jgi:PAS domain S-box-containing protein
MYKGWGFVAVTAALLYVTVRAQVQRLADQHDLRERAEAEARRSSERLRRLADAIDEVVWSFSPSLDEVWYVSPAFDRVWGLSREALEADPRAWLALVEPDHRAAVLAALGAPTRTELEFPVRRPDGQPRWLSLRTYPPPAGAASDAGLAAVTSDVTERRQLQAQLARAQKLEALGLLASGVAHDFNNLLTVVLANASLVEETTDRRDVEELTGEITRAAQRASGLTRQLLLYSRREAMEFRPLDLRTVVEDLTRMLRRLVREDVAIAVSAPPEPQPVVGDPGMLEQVVVNLVVNARDALPRGGSLQIGTRTVALSAADAAARGGDARVGVWVVLSVRDDGLGIPGAVLPRLFEPFFTTKEAGMGTGLGLALVLQVTRQHGGWVEVRSVEGAGSTFEVFLPAGAAAAERAASVEGAPPTVAAVCGVVLVVEDEPALRRVMVALLRRRGHEVVSCGSGDVALAGGPRARGRPGHRRRAARPNHRDRPGTTRHGRPAGAEGGVHVGLRQQPGGVRRRRLPAEAVRPSPAGGAGGPPRGAAPRGGGEPPGRLAWAPPEGGCGGGAGRRGPPIRSTRSGCGSRWWRRRTSGRRGPRGPRWT